MKRTLPAVVPVELEFPPAMEGPLRAVLEGEYDSPLFGQGLTVLDIGANVGAFCLWADRRWPRSTIHAYEPEPRTFEMLVRNVGHLPNVHCEHVAVYPSRRDTEPLISRYAGDIEAGLVDAMATTWRAIPPDRVLEVPVHAPGELPPADVVKVDAEGSEAAIVEGLGLEQASLLLLEYHNLANLRRILRATRGRFEVLRHNSYPWRPWLKNREYRPELRDDRFGTIVLARPGDGRLRRGEPPAPADPPLARWYSPDSQTALIDELQRSSVELGQQLDAKAIEAEALANDLARARQENARIEQSVTIQLFRKMSDGFYGRVGRQSLLGRSVQALLRLIGRVLLRSAES